MRGCVHFHVRSMRDRTRGTAADGQFQVSDTTNAPVKGLQIITKTPGPIQLFSRSRPIVAK
jgi:hypothetical protein